MANLAQKLIALLRALTTPNPKHPDPMTPSQQQSATMAAFLAAARHEIGTTEIPGPRTAERIRQYLATVELPATAAAEDETPWCAAFVNWTLARCGRAGTNSALARSFQRWGDPGKALVPGAIVVIARGKPWQGHVGFYAGNAGEDVLLVGGNQSDSVSVARFTRAQIVDIRYPIY
jgi:uncharacterized protein (TIGR02594 family)